MRRGAEPPEPVEGDAYARDDLPALPGSLESALGAFRADEGLRARARRAVQRLLRHLPGVGASAWRESVSDWERERYERAV